MGMIYSIYSQIFITTPAAIELNVLNFTCVFCGAFFESCQKFITPSHYVSQETLSHSWRNLIVFFLSDLFVII